MTASCLELSRGDVHLWALSLATDAPSLAALTDTLSIDERARALSFRHAEHRMRYVAARGQLRRILGRYLDMPPDSIVFSYGPRGKPALSSAANPLHFTISHSASHALCAFSLNAAVGIDLEHRKAIDNLDALARQIMSPLEWLLFSDLPRSQRLDAFYACWTRKEAYLKARGVGVATGLRDVSVSLADEPRPKLLQCEDPLESTDSWSLFSFRLGGDFASALAVRDKVHRCTWQQTWPDASLQANGQPNAFFQPLEM